MTTRIPLCLDIPKNGDLKEVLKLITRELLRHCGRKVNFDIWRWFPKRTNQQNKAVRGYWMGLILEEMGCYPRDNDCIYNALKLEFWFEDIVNEKTGRTVRVAKETHEDNIVEYAKFMDAFVEHMDHEHGIILPPPESIKAVI